MKNATPHVLTTGVTLVSVNTWRELTITCSGWVLLQSFQRLCPTATLICQPTTEGDTWPSLVQSQHGHNGCSGEVLPSQKSIFAACDVPREIVADSMRFKLQQLCDGSVCITLGFQCFKITTSSPNFPKSDGLAERYVQTIKQFLRKTADSGEDMYYESGIQTNPHHWPIVQPADMLFDIHCPALCLIYSWLL